MVSTGGGGFGGLPLGGGPTEVLIMLLAVAAIMWVALKLFSS